MIGFVHVLDGLGQVLTYPGEEDAKAVARCRKILAATHPEAGALLDGFALQIENLSQTERQELFTRTFDLNPVCTLEVGWHLFGEDYTRGRFMAKLRRAHCALGVAESGELPDHLTNVLKLLGRMATEEAAVLARTCVLPALDKMLVALSDKEHPYENALRAVRTVLAERFQTCPAEVSHG